MSEQYRVEVEVAESAWSIRHGTVGQWRDGLAYDTREEAEEMVAELLAVGTNARIKVEPTDR